jgi:NADH dehydrogenase (ubiquinone) 1 alpha subcomplex subunit 5
MFRFTRPLRQVLKRTTGIHGLAVHPDPLPALIKTYESTLSTLSSIPKTSVYRQSVEALVRSKLNMVKNASGDVTAAEQQLNEGQIEEALDIAADELSLAAKMIEWKAYANYFYLGLNGLTLFLQLGPIGGETRRRTVGIRGENYYCIIIHDRESTAKVLYSFS